jgi:ribosomal-protein-alanine N-acetyltransferase
VPYAAQGYMQEALTLVMEIAFCQLGLHRLEANIQPGNSASIALAKRCGFQKEGFSPRYLKINGDWKDHERWAILKEHFLSSYLNKETGQER